MGKSDAQAGGTLLYSGSKDDLQISIFQKFCQKGDFYTNIANFERFLQSIKEI